MSVRSMTKEASKLPLGHRVINRLYTESIMLADEARHYFDGVGHIERASLAPLARVNFSCESLKVTTRLMHVIAWLLTQRAVMAGELPVHDSLDPSRRLGDAPATEVVIALELPTAARALIHASEDLHRRIARLDVAQKPDVLNISPVRSMQNRLTLAF